MSIQVWKRYPEEGKRIRRIVRGSLSSLLCDRRLLHECPLVNNIDLLESLSNSRFCKNSSLLFLPMNCCGILFRFQQEMRSILDLKYVPSKSPIALRISETATPEESVADHQISQDVGPLGKWVCGQTNGINYGPPCEVCSRRLSMNHLGADQRSLGQGPAALPAFYLLTFLSGGLGGGFFCLDDQ